MHKLCNTILRAGLSANSFEIYWDASCPVSGTSPANMLESALLLGHHACCANCLACCLQREAAALGEQLQAATASHASEVHEMQLAAKEMREQLAVTRAVAAAELTAVKCACLQLVGILKYGIIFCLEGWCMQLRTALETLHWLAANADMPES